jgi:hypothetical protein
VEKLPAGKAMGLSQKAISAPSSASIAAVDATTRGRRCLLSVPLDAWRSMRLHHAAPLQRPWPGGQRKGSDRLQAVHIFSEAPC